MTGALDHAVWLAAGGLSFTPVLPLRDFSHSCCCCAEKEALNMNRRNFFRALSALAALPLAKLSPQKFADGGLVEAPKPAPVVGETIHVHYLPNEESLRLISEAISKGMREGTTRSHRGTP